MPNRSDSPTGRYICADMGGRARCAAHVVTVPYLVLDADRFKNADDAERLLAWAARRGGGFSFPTKRSTADEPRLRVFFCPSRRMTPTELRRAHDTLAREIEGAVPGVTLDARGGDAAQLWYGPARKARDGRTVPVRSWPGAPVNIDELFARTLADDRAADTDAEALARLPRGRVEGLTLDDVRPALLRISPEAREDWLRVGFALHQQWAETLEEDAAFDTWAAWSRGDLHRDLARRNPRHPTAAAWADAAAGKYDDGDQRQTWGAMRNDATRPARTIRSLFHRAGLPLPAHAVAHDGGDQRDRGEFVAPVTVDLQDIFDEFAPAPPAPRFVLDGLVPQGVVTLLAGHGGTGKTALALALALHLAAGRAWAGRDVAEARRTLFFSGEDDGAVCRYRIHHARLAYGIGADDVGDRLRVVDASNADAVLFQRTRDGCRTTHAFDWLANMCAEFQAEVVIIDNASETFAGDEVGRSDVRGFLRALRQLRADVTVLVLGHVDKNTARAGKAGEGYSGSTAWSNSARSRFLLHRDGQLLQLVHQKCNAAPLAAPIALRWAGPTPVPLTEAARSAADDEALRAVVRLVAEFTTRGEFISTAPNSTASAWRLLNGSPDLPAGMDRARLDGLLREGERRGLLARRGYRTEGRKLRTRWESTPEGGALAGPCPWE